MKNKTYRLGGKKLPEKIDGNLIVLLGPKVANGNVGNQPRSWQKEIFTSLENELCDTTFILSEPSNLKKLVTVDERGEWHENVVDIIKANKNCVVIFWIPRERAGGEDTKHLLLFNTLLGINVKMYWGHDTGCSKPERYSKNKNLETTLKTNKHPIINRGTIIYNILSTAYISAV